ncbi:DUF6807 domain-containing protein [Cryobacterium sp. AP23]
MMIQQGAPVNRDIQLRREQPGRLGFERDGLVLAEYVYEPQDAQLESPRPYLSPLRTLGGELVSLFRPHDHVWHKGIAWSLPVVGDENFWGGPTFVRDSGYVQLANNGTQRHRGFRETAGGAPARVSEDLDWITEAGVLVFTEEREFSCEIIDDRSWALVFTTAMRNVTDATISIGSPTTRGRDNAGYGGLFWRGPRSFTGGLLHAPGGSGGEELRGTREPWLGFSGQHDGSGNWSTIVMVDDPANHGSPPQWFARTEHFAALCPAPFFSTEVPVAPGDVLRLRYAVVISDGNSDHLGAARLAEAGLAALNASPK